jgi:metal-responsive CopG/Arc/MetJ family transcriptional regulator
MNNNDDFTQISIPNKLLWEIEALAEKENRTRNNMIEQLLWTAVNQAIEAKAGQ